MATDIKNYEEEYKALKKNYEEFLYIISHDLATPLRGISSLTSILNEELKGSDNYEVQEVLDLMNKGTVQLQSMMKTLLELSRIDRTNLETTKVNISEIVELVISDLDFLEKPQLEMPNELPLVNINEQDAYRICQIILENALIHNTSKDKKIKVSADIKDKKVRYSFEDNGTPIEQKDHELIWKIFRTADTPLENHLGTGLFLLRKLVEKYNGTAEYLSKNQSENVFVVELPLSI